MHMKLDCPERVADVLCEQLDSGVTIPHAVLDTDYFHALLDDVRPDMLDYRQVAEFTAAELPPDHSELYKSYVEALGRVSVYGLGVSQPTKLVTNIVQAYDIGWHADPGNGHIINTTLTGQRTFKVTESLKQQHTMTAETLGLSPGVVSIARVNKVNGLLSTVLHRVEDSAPGSTFLNVRQYCSRHDELVIARPA